MLTGEFKRVSLFCLADITKKNKKKEGKQLLGFKSHARDLSAARIMKFNHLTPLVASLYGMTRTTRGHVTGFSRSPEPSSSSTFKGTRSFRVSRPTGKVLRRLHHDTAMDVHACVSASASVRTPSVHTGVRKSVQTPWRVVLLFSPFRK